MKVVVTGGNGLLGTHLKNIAPDWIYLSRKDCDLTNPDRTEYVLSYLQPDVIVHLAAKVGGIQFNIENQPELLADNLLINTNVISTAQKLDAQVIAFLSTCIYPNVSNSYPMFEHQICQGDPPPSNKGYALAKRIMYEHIQILNDKYNSGHICLVPSNMYGCSKKDVFSEHAHFVPALIRKIKQLNSMNKASSFASILWKKKYEEQLTFMGDGSPLRQFTYAGDVAMITKVIVEELLNEIEGETINIATPENLSIKEMVETAIKTLGIKNYHPIWDTSKPNGQHRKDVASDKLNEISIEYYGSPVKFTPFKEGIKRVYDFISS